MRRKAPQRKLHEERQSLKTHEKNTNYNSTFPTTTAFFVSPGKTTPRSWFAVATGQEGKQYPTEYIDYYHRAWKRENRVGEEAD